MRSWLLVEQPGAWGPRAWQDSDLPSRVVDSLARRAGSLGARVLLIRRPGRTGSSRRRWAFVDSRPGAERLWWNEFSDPAELLEISPGSGVESAEPLYLVCAHGRHDTCCALMGRPVAAALAAERPENTWECTHIGGDRFAANVLVLPHGLYYGQVLPSEAPRLVAAHESGQLLLERHRGRSAYTAPVQAAQHFTRQRTGNLSVDSHPPLSVERVAEGVWDVQLEDAPTLRVATTQHRSDSGLTCKAPGPGTFRGFTRAGS
ncbi:sucrase ferredoxin [Actinokineospora auranticolor]|uniref:sucrase ferredoxin n=1 Tax=Actinokineospora auranticolor TaxID=155976 RepID=UPI003CCBACA4